jgi:ABC-type uncharacterized transport system auxiliary subunit
MMRAAWVGLALLLCGCLPAVMVAEPRYFAPLVPPAAAEQRVAASASSPLLRVRPVTAALHLRERMVWRRSGSEFGFHELVRWTQPPARWVDQWLARELFEQRGMRRALAGARPLLRVELLAFDEILEPQRAVRVEFSALLSDPLGVALLERTYVAERPVEGRGPAGVARAMGAALAEAISSLGADTQDALASLGP